jgi:hypothetical protein
MPVRRTIGSRLMAIAAAAAVIVMVGAAASDEHPPSSSTTGTYIPYRYPLPVPNPSAPPRLSFPDAARSGTSAETTPAPPQSYRPPPPEVTR